VQIAQRAAARGWQRAGGSARARAARGRRRRAGGDSAGGGAWNVGVWMASALLKWHRYCYNQRVSERLRPGFPVLGMYDTWLIDHLQVLVSLNWSVLLFPEWSNTGDYAPTPETFDTVRRSTRSRCRLRSS
jgi:hypothetical protein